MHAYLIRFEDVLRLETFDTNRNIITHISSADYSHVYGTGIYAKRHNSYIRCDHETICTIYIFNKQLIVYQAFINRVMTDYTYMVSCATPLPQNHTALHAEIYA